MEIKLGTTLSNGQVLTENTVSVFEYNYTLPTPLEGRYLTLTLRDLIQYFVICELMVYAGKCRVNRDYVHNVAIYQKYLTRLGELIIFEPWLENYHFSQPR